MSPTAPVHYSPPWANTHIIGIAGSSGSGKTSLAVKIVAALNLPWVVILSMDSFYKTLTPEQSKLAFANEYDFDAPSSIDFDILVEKLRDLKQGRKAEIPVYSFEKHQRQPQTTTIYSCHVLVLEGIFALYDQRVLDLLDMKIYVDTDADVCLARRLARDIKYRGRELQGAIKQWMTFVKPNYELYVEPQQRNADIMVPRGIENTTAIQMIVRHIQRALLKKSDEHIASLRKLNQGFEAEEPLAPNIKVLKESNQLTGMHTILHNRDTPREEFVFYFDRISTLLIERAMDHLDHDCKEVETPQGLMYKGFTLRGEVNAVVVLRSGGTLEVGLKRVVPDAKIGRILIQSNARTGEPELHYLKLPPTLHQHSVLVLDPQIASGAAALMTITVLKDHGVKEENIVFVTYLGSVAGLRRMSKVFPKVRIVIGRIQDAFEQRWIDERYFGS
ncbi:uridine kinase family-domain-containing protein [Tricharina praecox]|uniref:uridine kinase family-domain-containing protein n=1 Tax=Tricharina praecox TaxID=43433 RepID=UPI00221E8AEA|nr:uridine kinase family-domain-containing protein [Tricharina praecox]KAI5848240.1 uridine kinase family-domain-containing protein [Tricharina praecox]